MQYLMPCQGKNAEQILKVAEENRKRRECLIQYQHCFLVATDYHKDAKDTGSRKLLTQIALKRIKNAPYLTELRESTNWDIMFAPKLGEYSQLILDF